MLKVVFILNKRSKKKRKFYRQLLACKHRMDFDFNVIETSERGVAVSLAHEYAKDQYTHIVACGGDGTINEVLNGVLRYKVQSKITMGIIPLGTANDFVKSADIPLDISDFLDALHEGQTRSFYTGCIEFNDDKKRYFMNIADVGMGAEVVKRVNRSSKWLGSKLTFMKAIVQTFISFKKRKLNVEDADWTWTSPANSVIVANGRYFGSGMGIAPEADPEVPFFQVVLNGDISLKDYLKNSKTVRKAIRVNHEQVQYKTSMELKIDHDDMPMGVESDGEYLGETPVRISVGPKVKFVVNKKALR